MLRRPPISTLFAYTTLFRSFVMCSTLAICVHYKVTMVLGMCVILLRVTAHAQYHRDRKSTRLNSSHVKISYAVFCLKKKKKKLMSHSRLDRKHVITRKYNG